MIEYSGKCNAKVMIDEIDETTSRQIYSIIRHPAMSNESNIRIMPDCHAGAGCVIGFTQKIIDSVIPNLVGVN